MERHAAYELDVRILLWRLWSDVVRRHGHIPDSALRLNCHQDQGQRARSTYVSV